jgi:CheY-like chemotaxis protein/HPt (histidine-containing phosphotransfer) domain-containing protein
LVAEDGFDNQELIRSVLRKAGAEVELAENGRIAVNKATAPSFDVILMDINMPEMDGYEATRTLRSRGYEGPILALTANAMVGETEHCLSVGCNDHLTKPINRSHLIHTIARYAGRPCCDDEESPESASADAGGEEGILRSELADDPVIAQLLGEFVTGLASQLGEMQSAFDAGQYQSLRKLAHRLKGSGGSYGYPTLTEAAKVLEVAADSADVEAARAALGNVASLCHAIEAGLNIRATADTVGKSA